MIKNNKIPDGKFGESRRGARGGAARGRGDAWDGGAAVSGGGAGMDSQS